MDGQTSNVAPCLSHVLCYHTRGAVFCVAIGTVASFPIFPKEFLGLVIALSMSGRQTVVSLSLCHLTFCLQAAATAASPILRVKAH